MRPSTRPRWAGAIPAGVIDAGGGALATFAVGVFAARVLSAPELGIYALFFSAFVLATKLPRQFVFVPAEVRAVESGPVGVERLGYVRPAVVLSLLPGLASGIVASGAAVLLAGSHPPAVLIAFAVTMGLCGMVQPIETHMRRMFHVAGKSWLAPIASITQLLGVAAAIVIMSAADVPDPWIPFGAFVIGLLASVAVAAGLMRRMEVRIHRVSLTYGGIWRSGSQLLLVDLVPSLTNFLGASLVLALAGPAVLGYTEAARIAARPIGVFAFGMQSPLRPRSVKAAAERDEVKAQRVTRTFTLLLAVTGFMYLVYAGFDWPGNIMAVLVPKAYVVPWLVAVTVVSVTAQVMSEPQMSELIGGRREPSLVRIELVGNFLRVLFALSASILKWFALPCGVIALGVTRWVGRSRAADRLYRPDHA